MNSLIWIDAIFVAATLLIIDTPNATMAYSCSSSASTNNLHNRGAGVSGSSGSCSTSSSSTSSSRLGGLGGVNVNDQGPNTVELLSITRTTHGVWEEILSTSSGGAQSSCSSSSATGSDGLKLTSNSISKAGHCP